MKVALIFDVYGTLVDPVGMVEHLTQDVGCHAKDIADCWNDKEREYCLRRGLMRDYAEVSLCRLHALDFACRRFNANVSLERRNELRRLYHNLPAANDVIPALEGLRAASRLFALDNGTKSEITSVLANSNLLHFFEDLIAAGDVCGFKPDPVVYHHAKRVIGTEASVCWLVSGNPWDLFSAKSAGLATAWVRRSEEPGPGPTGTGPDLTISSLLDLPAALLARFMQPRLAK